MSKVEVTYISGSKNYAVVQLHKFVHNWMSHTYFGMPHIINLSLHNSLSNDLAPLYLLSCTKLNISGMLTYAFNDIDYSMYCRVLYC